MKKKYGMPYMGSKDKILNLIEYIFGRHYDAKYFIDLFCGGGSVFHYALEKSNFKVIANDIDTYVIALFEEIIFNKSKEIKKVWYNWIDKDVFKDVITNCNNYPKWYVGFVKTIWSFGNSGKNYLFGKDIENQKKALHQALVFDDWSFMKIEKLEFRASDKIRQIDYKTNSNKRIFFMSEFKKHIGNKRFELEQLEQLERLQELQQLQQLEQLQRLELLNLDWNDALKNIGEEKLNKSFIYCDIPYEDTAGYTFGGFNHKEFWKWFRTTPYPVYASSYKAPKDIKIVNFENKTQLLNSNRRIIKKENIYWNGKGKINETIVDILFN